MADAPRCSVAVGIAHLAALRPHVAQSHMFCAEGVSTYRALLDMLGVSFVGSSVDAMTLTTHKARSKAVVEKAGVRVPPSQLLRYGERPSLPLPSAPQNGH